jgi:flavin reductase (DIM6/NTAB) family NADH-FMN oxidoreductase RutF
VEKTNIGSQIFIYPMAVAIVGVMVEEKPNFMTLAWLTRVNVDPPLLGIAINKTHYTASGIRQRKAFSINFPSEGMIEKTDFVGIASGRDTDKSTLFDVFWGETKSAPMIRECPLCLDCRLYGIYDFPKNDLFVGEIVAAYTEERYLTEGKPDIRKMKPVLLTMPDNNYWGVGDWIAGAWSVGKPLVQEKG